MGLPSALLTIADNQRGIASALAVAGAALDLGWHADVDPQRIAEKLRGLFTSPERLASMSARGREIVDGEGAARVAMRLEGARVRVRRARAGDCERLWHWTNDPETRARGFSSAQVPWTDHITWFEKKITTKKSLLLIGIDADDAPVGQVRFDCDAEKIGTISISIDRSRRGEGLGLAMLRAGLRAAQAAGIRGARSLVKPDNQASLRMFTAAGFAVAEPVRIGADEAMHFRLDWPAPDPSSYCAP